MNDVVWRIGLEGAIAARYGTTAPAASWGVDRTTVPRETAPIDDVVVYAQDGDVPHWHYIGLGLTSRPVPGVPDAGLLHELTFRLERHGEERPPHWPRDLLQHVGRYLTTSGEQLGPGHTFDLNAPVTPDAPSPLRHLLFAPDPDLPEVFLQAVGITSDELAAHEQWPGFGAVLAQHLPLLITRPTRVSTLALPGVVAPVDQGSASGTAQRAVAAVTTLEIRPSTRLTDRALRRSRITVTLSTHPVDGLRRALLGRVARGAPFMVRGQGAELLLVPEEGVGPHREEPNCWVVGLSPDQAVALADTLAPVVGTYRAASLPAVTFDIRPSPVVEMAAPESDPRWP